MFVRFITSEGNSSEDSRSGNKREHYFVESFNVEVYKEMPISTFNFEFMSAVERRGKF